MYFFRSNGLSGNTQEFGPSRRRTAQREKNSPVALGESGLGWQEACRRWPPRIGINASRRLASRALGVVAARDRAGSPPPAPESGDRGRRRDATRRRHSAPATPRAGAGSPGLSASGLSASLAFDSLSLSSSLAALSATV